MIFFPFNHFYLILLLLFQWHQDIIPAFFTISGLDIRLSDIFVLVLVAKILIEKREIALGGKIPKLILFYLLTGLFSELNNLSTKCTTYFWTVPEDKPLFVGFSVMTGSQTYHYAIGKWQSELDKNQFFDDLFES